MKLKLRPWAVLWLRLWWPAPRPPERTRPRMTPPKRKLRPTKLPLGPMLLWLWLVAESVAKKYKPRLNPVSPNSLPCSNLQWPPSRRRQWQ